jgi:hypothetical protein
MTTQTAAAESKSAEGRRNPSQTKMAPDIHPLGSVPIYGNQAMLQMHSRRAPALQAKLRINTPGDSFEQEADQVADRVMCMADPAAGARSFSIGPAGTVQRKCSCGGEGGECAACAEKKEEGLQRFASGRTPSASAGTATAPPVVHQVLSSPGQPLDSATRDFMEARFGQHFGGVRVHTNARAAESARSVNALAYTLGNNVVFGQNSYSPRSETGQRLLAHELTHVLQQGSQPLTIQRQPSQPVDAEQRAIEVEAKTCIDKDEQRALEMLDSLDMRDLLNVTAKLYDTWEATQNQKPQKPGEAPAPTCTAFAELNADLKTDNEATNKIKAGLSPERIQRLMAAFDAARVHKLTNPLGPGMPGTSPTLSQSRDRSDPTKRPGPVRPGDWGKDPAGNIWVMHAEGVRSCWINAVNPNKCSSQWLGKNVGNFGGNRAVAHRMIGSFPWGGYDRALYNSEQDSEADLRENMGKSATVGSYIENHHLGPGDNPKVYYSNLQAALTSVDRTLIISPGDPTSKWVTNNDSWEKLFKAFRSAEGWFGGEAITTSNVDSTSSKPEDAPLVAYYKSLLGVAAAPAPQPSPGATPSANP